MAKILLVDDDIELTALLKDILSLEGYNVIEANNGIEGLAAITDDLDLILLDIMMPKMNGMDMLRKLRETNETPVLMLTAKGEEIDRVIGLELGADDYLPKPFSDRELLARIRAILRRTQGKTKESNSSSIKYQDIELFVGKQEAYRNGELMELTGTEFGLLSQFIQKPGEIISKEDLSLEVLGKRLAPFDRAIDMHVSNLRKKLPPLSEGKPRIKTLRGRGYLFVEE
ncbi:response regulator [Aliivibrio fischeri]|uniref:DNA-binding response regulator in two-component regulatory system with CpxA n=2 Tax=Aliivibrio fischeri TaxID=668 RepID=Q5E2A8_ALIF1|nr:response regulator [Aliivibrio fischeri]AAW86838.1 DNA-binding response regulator in two-component regulatory system with CpxA [Aliivibrio fischeri ES114]KLU78646.1 transcriptional regulator [Aliivibrio fischeri]MCE7537506.1 response regulator [Aliivibrio fischeri]MCE7560358.1 response regulator [Aliivibrio fischeri]MCE7568051.1 response regulator [Aliivibrio fischeri]